MKIYKRRTYTNQAKIFLKIFEEFLSTLDFDKVEEINITKVGRVGGGEYLIIFKTHDEETKEYVS